MSGRARKGHDGSPRETQIQRHVRGESLESIATTIIRRLVQARAADEMKASRPLRVDSSDPALMNVMKNSRLPCVSFVEPGLCTAVAVIASRVVIDVQDFQCRRPMSDRPFPETFRNQQPESASSSRPNISTRSPGARAHTEPRAWTLPPSPRPPTCPSRCCASPRPRSARRPPPDAIRRANRFVPRHACRPLAGTGKRTTRRDEARSTWRPRRSRRTRVSTT